MTTRNILASIDGTPATYLAEEPANFGSSGSIGSMTKRWIGTVSPNTSNGYSIDISSASFSVILNFCVIAIRNTATVTSVPQVAVKSVSTSALVVNIVEGNSTLTNILGVNVPLGLPLVFANVTGLTLQVMVEGT